MQALSSTPESGALWFLNRFVKIASSRHGDGIGMSVLEHHMPYGDAPPFHVHEDEDELFYVLEGEIAFQIREQTVIARAGDTVVAPRKQPHGFRVVSAKGARMLTITGGGFEDMVRSASRPAMSAELPEAVEPTPEMQNALGTLCAANGITLLGPPIAA